MKKRIIFMLINMNVGGTEKALLNMIDEMPKEEYDITILMLEEYGGFLSQIPNDVNVIYVEGYKDMKSILNNPLLLTALSLLKERKIKKAFSVCITHLLTKITNNRSLLFKYLLKNNLKLKNEYDIAVAYAGPMDFISYFVVNKIKAEKKIQWIHFDVTRIGFNVKFSKKIYRKFDQIFVVSNEARVKLLNKLPSISGKTEVFKNRVSVRNTQELAKEGKGFNDLFDGIRIVTVGRLTNEKGQDLAIKALARLINDGYKVRWYCIGEGNSRKTYEELIEKNNLNNHFVLLGSNPNPYAFIANCDIYVQPSRYEGYCITTLEAKCLNKPIITTDVNGAREQIVHGETGLIVNIDEIDLFNAIKKLINNEELRLRISKTLQINNDHHDIEMKKLVSLI